MASLNKLAIRGIRSFDDKQIAVIEFFSPVTVIVGHNGSGKTTIIECLKYATTGDQPPNTKGGAFIHDPKMANEKEVKAQVKLRFHAANGQRMLAVRNLSVSMKKTGGLTMKTLESILAIADDNMEKVGKRGAISTKCAEMDAEIPNLLGVSKAVLENVIFCHQEDSYWPLSEPATLKKKFDEIFEATKYTKALDSIKSLRKDRMADLKAEKERLELVSHQKGHADKLRGRITDLQNEISTRELMHEETKRDYEILVAANQKFYDSATKFRETYTRVENLEKTKTRFEADLADAKENLQELQGTDDELASRLSNFDNHIAEQKRKRRTEEAQQQDLEEELTTARKTHSDQMGERGTLQAQLQAQQQQLSDREQLIREIADKHSFKGYDHSPLSRDEVLEFIAKLKDLVHSKKREAEKLKLEGKKVTDEFNSKLRQLTGALEKLVQKKETLRGNTKERQNKIALEEQKLDDLQDVPASLNRIQEEMSSLDKRVDNMKAYIKQEDYSTRFTAASTKARGLEIKRDELTDVMRTLNLQADKRAKLDINRSSVRSKTRDIEAKIDANKSKFRDLVGADMEIETMETNIDKAIREHERALGDLEKSMNGANQDLKSSETAISSISKEIEEKRAQAKKLERQISTSLDDYDLPEGMTREQVTLPWLIEDSARELAQTQKIMAELSTSKDFWELLLRQGQDKKCCPLCSQSMNTQILGVYEEEIQRRVSEKKSDTDPNELERDLREWKKWVDISKELTATENERLQISANVVPALEQKLSEERARFSQCRDQADAATGKVDEAKRKQKELARLKQDVIAISNLKGEVDELVREVERMERDLSASGSTKTVQEVQHELESITAEIRTVEKDRNFLSSERERRFNALRDDEAELLKLQVKESQLKHQMHEKETLEQHIEEMREEEARSTTLVKDLDVQISDAQAPIKQLEATHLQEEKEWTEKIRVADQTSQALNQSYDRLELVNKAVEREAKQKTQKKLDQCNDRIAESEGTIESLNADLEAVRARVQSIEKEISDAGSAMANLRENLRVRKLVKDIAATAEEIATYDMEEAAKARRNFQEKYNVEKEKETQKQSDYARIGGELNSLRAQLKTQETDMKDYKDIAKQYREQLVKVKLSDMANNDLEKYAKALDNAIMKYHSLKMEEVNDTMRHLWNKTYQGTDIDGIKICSDSEGGATKRSYNYRVVMTKDNVEMDMRGRCSAGQKMLASIIIRLALADSFGQNCGILALDEPTNALDTENIDALAESLVDIINERKTQGHFQLIIITHDENFLKKLGQSDVMEYYWRVARDARQKSMIERHRFS